MKVKEAIEVLEFLESCSYVDEFEPSEKEALKMAINALKPKTAYWVVVIDEIDNFGNKTWHYKCSKCGNTKSGWGEFKHCPDCGRRMYKKRSDI